MREFLSSQQLYPFIAAQTTDFTVLDLCQSLGVSRSVYNAWQQRPARTNEMTRAVITAFWRHKRRYGSQRLTVEMQVAEYFIE